MDDSFSWLHLTDFHFGLKGQGCLWPTLRQPFYEDLARLHDLSGPWSCVLFTGDLVQSGQSAQFREMQVEVLDKLWTRLIELGSPNANLLAVPGNHDLYRPDPAADDAAVDRLNEEGGYKQVHAKFWELQAGVYRQVVTNAFAAYDEWWAGQTRAPSLFTRGALPGDFAATIESNGRRIGIMGLNTAFLQLRGGDLQGKLAWDPRQVQAVCQDGVDVWTNCHDVCLLLTHHGPEWLDPEARKVGESEIAPAGRFAVHLFGHQHETKISYSRTGGSRNVTRLYQASSVFGMELFGHPPTEQRSHGYAAGRIEFGEEAHILRLWPRVASVETKRWRFIPDHVHAELEESESTVPEPVAPSSPAKTPKGSRQRSPGTTHDAGPRIGEPHSTLPTRQPFFGRAKDLEEIAKSLVPTDRSWGVVLDGPGGVGKTALALEAAHRAPAELYPLRLWITAKTRQLHPDGEIELTDHPVVSFFALLSELGLALGRNDVAAALPNDRPALIRHALSNHHALLVLDNLETFSFEEQRRTFELLAYLPSNCRAIVTSRRRAKGSFAAHYIRLDKLEREAVDQLLEELGRRWPPVSNLTPLDRDQLYAETGGNPLLITWTAGQLGRTTGRCRTITEAINRLREAHRLQSVNESNDPLHFVFGDLVETFTNDETEILAALAHFTQPAQLSWLVPLTSLSSKAAETALDGLRDRALLIENASSGTWFLPPLAARYLKSSCPQAIGTAGEKLTIEALAIASENGLEAYDRYPILESNWPQLAAALPMLMSGNNRQLQTMCDALQLFLRFSGRWDTRIALLTAAETSAHSARDYRRAGWRAYQLASTLYNRNFELSELLTIVDRTASHWNLAVTGARERAALASLRLRTSWWVGDVEQAIIYAREAVALAGSDYCRSIVLNDLGFYLMELGHLPEAEDFLTEALSFATSTNDAESIAVSQGFLSVLAIEREDWAVAERFARASLKTEMDLGRKDLRATCYWRLALVLARQGRGDEGAPYALEAVEILGQLGDRDLPKAQAAFEECTRIENQTR